LFPTCLAVAFNAFGLDSTLGLDRYKLLPLSNKQKLLSKNLAFAAVMMALYMTLVPVAFWKLGTRAVVLGFVELIIVWLAYVSIGNHMSVKQPFKMQFYRFASGGSPVDALMGMVSGSIPALIIVLLLSRAGGEALWAVLGIALLLLIYLALFYVTLTRAARALDNRWEELRRSLT
jgi:predicted permease